jgi:Effector-associated domain 8
MSEHLADRFEQLRVEGRTDQTPVFYSRQDWRGGSREIGRIPECVRIRANEATPMLNINDQIRAMLRPLMGDRQSRRARLARAFANYPELRDRIDVDGETGVFLDLLINTLHNYGEVGAGRPAISVLLESVKSEVGAQDRARIERIIAMPRHEPNASHGGEAGNEDGETVESRSAEHPAVRIGRVSGSILIDEAHGQSKWNERPVADGGYSSAIAAIGGIVNFKVNKDESLSRQLLESVSVLVMSTPFTPLTDSECDAVTRWVSAGHSLLALGTYLMEQHHSTNLNRLARPLGVDFSLDIIAPKIKGKTTGRLPGNTNYRNSVITTQPMGSPGSHPLLQDVPTVSLESACSIKEPGGQSELVVVTRENCSTVEALGPKDSDGKILYIDGWSLLAHTHPCFMLAIRSGAGRVIGIGSWKIFLNRFVDDRQIGNRQLFENCIRWLLPQRV